MEEVRKIAQKIRLDIEKKKEDLRQMVGWVPSPPSLLLDHIGNGGVNSSCRERYRDLIDAADSIVDMKMCSEHVCVFQILTESS